MNELKFLSYCHDEHYGIVCELFKAYFDELFINDFEINLSEADVHEIIGFVEKAILEDNNHLYLCTKNLEYIGFCNWQIDREETSWWKKEDGWGFIGEFYIKPVFRNCGYGKMLYEFVEKKLSEAGIKKIYLTTCEKTGKAFFEKMGYTNSGEKTVNNGDEIYFKNME